MSNEPFTGKRALRELYCNVCNAAPDVDSDDARCDVWIAIQEAEKRKAVRSKLRLHCVSRCAAYRFVTMIEQSNFEIRRKVGRRAFKP